MLEAGNILYVYDFQFKNGNSNRNKYFIVLKVVDGDLLVASLPTKVDHVPTQILKEHGCLNDDNLHFNCYYFPKGHVITCDTNFGFPLDTYVYGEEVDNYSVQKFNDTYTYLVDYKFIGKIKDSEFMNLLDCLKRSGQTKRRIKRLL
ncbi:hypothetical protein AALK14_06695 [Butyricimonas hominis]|uniref:hypothetical protein n=1 Tax=Butyricimonas TaxID=574697 RepID=UPI00351537EA